MLPNKINALSKICISKKEDDLQASRVLAEFGCVKQLDEWKPPHPLFVNLKQLTREKRQLKLEGTLIKNQLHAKQTKAITSSNSIKRMTVRLKLIEKQITNVEKEITDVVDQDESIKEKIEKYVPFPVLVCKLQLP